MRTTPLDCYRRAACALAEYACGYDAGRGKDDRVYVAVTEGRDGPGGAIRRGYSSCGDLAHWLLERMGVREPWVNRASLGQYRVGANVSTLAFGAPCARSSIEEGDVVVVWNDPRGADAHVMIALGWIGDTLRTANYGAGGMSSAAWPGARLGGARVAFGNYGKKRIQRVLSWVDLMPLCRAPADLYGASIDGETLDAFGPETML